MYLSRYIPPVFLDIFIYYILKKSRNSLTDSHSNLYHRGWTLNVYNVKCAMQFIYANY